MTLSVADEEFWTVMSHIVECEFGRMIGLTHASEHGGPARGKCEETLSPGTPLVLARMGRRWEQSGVLRVGTDVAMDVIVLLRRDDSSTPISRCGTLYPPPDLMTDQNVDTTFQAYGRIVRAWRTFSKIDSIDELAKFWVPRSDIS